MNRTARAAAAEKRKTNRETLRAELETVFVTVTDAKCVDCAGPVTFYLVPDKVWDGLGLRIEDWICMACMGQRLNPNNPPKTPSELNEEIIRQKDRFDLREYNFYDEFDAVPIQQCVGILVPKSRLGKGDVGSDIKGPSWFAHDFIIDNDGFYTCTTEDAGLCARKVNPTWAAEVETVSDIHERTEELHTHLIEDGSCIDLTISRADYVCMAHTGPGIRGTVTDTNTGKRYSIRGKRGRDGCANAKLGLECYCDSSAKLLNVQMEVAA